MLFDPCEIRGLRLDNRIVVSPLCQYSAVDGCMTDWHLQHLMTLSMSGAGLLCFEMTDVEAIGRITHGCSGLWSDANEAALKGVIASCRRHGSARLAIQLAHAGRKGSNVPPWQGARPLKPEEGAWQTVGPSAVPMAEGLPVPRELATAEVKALVRKFVDAARRCERLGFDAIEIHGAHGYLIHQFLSPISNRRTDEYGGPLANRMRFALEVFEGVRKVWPESKPLGIRLSCTDGVEGAWDLPDTVALTRELQKLGCDWIDCSSGGSTKARTAATNQALHVGYSARVRKETGARTMAVGLITQAKQAEAILAEGQADLIAIGRGFMWDPRWAWHAAVELGVEPRIPSQYLRAQPGK